MSYSGISVREAIEKLNSPNNGWFLPQVQRQYVWGARHESETYVCLLLDSLLKRYPIGGIVLWETNERVPYREFVTNYEPGHFARQVDEGRWGAHKALVYDGQQRLQTLYSVLRYRFNGRILHYDLLFDRSASTAEPDETGFLFRDAKAAPESRYLRMTELSSMQCNDNEKVSLEERALTAARDRSEEMRIRANVHGLWTTFVDTTVKSIAYFSVKADTPLEVNEVFRRLNTGGVSLTQLELVLGTIKHVQPDYEEKLWEVSETIKDKSDIEFSSTAVLQFFHLLIKNTIRIDANGLKSADIPAFQDALTNDVEPLIEVFSTYIRGIFNINHASIVPRWLAVLPIAVYLTERKRNGYESRIRALNTSQLQPITKYFLLSQFCDWNTQTMVNAFAREARAAARSGQEFPFEKLRQIAIEKNRTGELHEHQLLGLPWLATKILMRNRIYVFHENKPQVDHIFPINLAGQNEDYQNAVDVLWNFQVMPADVNNYKRARHPQEFFLSEDGSKYRESYDYIPDPGSDLWRDHIAFIHYRKGKMLEALEAYYGLTIVTDSP